MSIASMTNRFTATLKRQGGATSAHGDKTYSYSTANRTADGVSTTIQADFQTADADENIQYGIKEDEFSWCMYTASDPKLTTKDQVVWADSGGVERTCRVVGPSFDMAGRGTIWKTMVSEKKNWS
jgi:hypothetical protein